jgi:hypothetical protein
MKVNCHKKADGGVSIHYPTSEVLALLTGTGYGWSDAQMAYEASKFRTAKADGSPAHSEAMTIEWVTALGRGGLSETEAQDLIRRRTDERHAHEASEVLEDTDLPSDRYFRNAWTWSD